QGRSVVSGSLLRGAFDVVDRCLAPNPTMRHQGASAGCSAGRGGGGGAAVRSKRSTPVPASWRVESRSQRTVTLGSRRTVGGSSLIQSRGFSPIGCVARIRRRLRPY